MCMEWFSLLSVVIGMMVVAILIYRIAMSIAFDFMGAVYEDDDEKIEKIVKKIRLLTFIYSFMSFGMLPSLSRPPGVVTRYTGDEIQRISCIVPITVLTDDEISMVRNHPNVIISIPRNLFSDERLLELDEAAKMHFGDETTEEM